jgi:protein-S-isoprenylcysteine O-methyltransferase Ste14
MKRHYVENLLPLLFILISVGIIYYYFRYKTHNYFGIAFMIIGLLIWWFGKLTLGDAWAIKAKAKKLVTKGIYSKIRHPIYVGLTLTLVGWAFYIPCPVWAIASIVAVIIFIVRARKEEKVLSNKFGKRYQKYKQKSWF